MPAVSMKNDTTDAQSGALPDDLFAEVDEAVAYAESLSAHVPAGRHPSLSALCDKLHAIIVGQRAEELLANPESIPRSAGVWVAPSWVWLYSRVNVGRKERAADGTRLRLPVRVGWSDGPLQFVSPDAAHEAPWSAAGLGHANVGTLEVASSATILEPVVVDEPTGMPSEVTVPVCGYGEILDELRRLSEAGRVARWRALEYLEPYISRALLLAQTSVSYELSQMWGSHQTVLDQTKLETIRDQMLLGDDGHPGKVAQLLERCLKPETFHRVEPLKYIKESLRRDANTEVRRAIGDPHIGAKVRRVARDLGTRDIDAVVDEYRLLYPKDRLSKDRASAALSVAPDAMANWWELPAFDDR